MQQGEKDQTPLATLLPVSLCLRVLPSQHPPGYGDYPPICDMALVQTRLESPSVILYPDGFS